MLWDLIDSAFKHSNNQSGNEIPAHLSLYDYLKEEAPKRVLAELQLHRKSLPSDVDLEVEAKRRSDLVLDMAAVWGAYVGSETCQQSLRYLWLEECLDGENLFCAGTYEAVLEQIAEPVLKAADIRYNCQVTKIKSRSTPKEKVTVQTVAGETMEFDEVVVTAPLGWLKRNLDAFEPKVPRRFEEAVHALGYGSLDKVSFTRHTFLPCTDIYCAMQQCIRPFRGIMEHSLTHPLIDCVS